MQTTKTKRIPVSPKIWKKMHEVKEAGQTYDDLLEELIELKKKARLYEYLKKIEKSSESLPLEDVIKELE
jgi:predicted CopG family antitoxin